MPDLNENLYQEKLKWLIENPSRLSKMSMNAQNKVYDKFGLEIIGEKWIALFDELGRK